MVPDQPASMVAYEMIMDGDASSRAVSSHINARPKWSRRGAVSRSLVGIAVYLGGTRVPMRQTSATLRLFDPKMSKCVSRGPEPGRAANALVSCPPPFFFWKDWRRWRGFRFSFRPDGRKGESCCRHCPLSYEYGYLLSI